MAFLEEWFEVLEVEAWMALGDLVGACPFSRNVLEGEDLNGLRFEDA